MDPSKYSSFILYGTLANLRDFLEDGELTRYLAVSWHLFHLGSFSVCFHQSMHRTKKFPWQHDLLEASLRAAGMSGAENGTKLFISNLGYGVTNEDIRVQFLPSLSIMSFLCYKFLKVVQFRSSFLRLGNWNDMESIMTNMAVLV